MNLVIRDFDLIKTMTGKELDNFFNLTDHYINTEEIEVYFKLIKDQKNKKRLCKRIYVYVDKCDLEILEVTTD